MDSFTGKLAVVTGGGSGMGRELVRQLAAQGCSVAACDLNADTVTEIAAVAQAGAQVRVAVVMPGHVGTDIIANSLRARGLPELERMSDAQVEELIPRDVQAKLIRVGLLAEGASADDLRQMLVRMNADFRDKAPVSAAQAATVILEGVRSGAWRILIGKDAKTIDAAVRGKPEAAYDYAELFSEMTRAPATGTPER